MKTIFFILFIYLSSNSHANNKYSLTHGLLSIYAVERNSGKVLIEHNSHLSLVPCSCLKLVTTIAALNLLGPDHRFTTLLLYDGFIDDTKTLNGNVYIEGGGDPCLGSDRIIGSLSWEKQIEQWANTLQSLGIQKIRGKIIADASKWEKALAVPSWLWEDLGNYYGAGACALSFHENFYALTFAPGEEEGTLAPILYTDPPQNTSDFHNEVLTGPINSGDNSYIYGSEYSPTRFIRGTIPPSTKERPFFSIKGSISDPPNYCSSLLTKELQRRGISIEQETLSSQIKTVCHTTYSPRVEDIVFWTNQKSINLYAEHLLKAMGEKMYQEGSTTAGVKAVRHFLKSLHIDIGGFYMLDGSGLSRKNLITTKQLVEIFAKQEKSSLLPTLIQSLPVKGESMRVKSGTMSQSKGYVGCTNSIIFAVLINNCTEPKEMQEKMQQILSELESIQ